ncbi:MAG: META domain-containing protein [Woeseiaceae bacterium]
MKSAMGFGFFLLFLAGIALVMLQGREMARQNLPGGGSGMAGLDWRPVMIGDLAVAADTSMFVRFAVDGSVKGNGGCNNFFSTLETTDDGIAMGQMGATRMACPPDVMSQEQAFLQALQAAARFEMGDDSLQMLSADDTLLAEFALANDSE